MNTNELNPATLEDEFYQAEKRYGDSTQALLYCEGLIDGCTKYTTENSIDLENWYVRKAKLI